MTARAQALTLYESLLLIRRAEEKIQAHYAEDDMKTPVHLYIGQEAVAAGVVNGLDPADPIVGTYRSHGIYLARTDDPEGFFAELYGRVGGPAKGKAGSMHMARPQDGLFLTSAVVATTIPVALGLAFTQQYRKTGRSVAAFFGDGAMDEGVFWESLNFACLKRLPVLFVCEDNGLAIHTPSVARRGYKSVADAVGGFDCHFVESESTDPAEISDLTRDALARQREDGRPVFMRLRCYRYVEHVGPREDRDFHLGYRREEEFEYWRARDPVRCQRERLIKLGVPEAEVAALETKIDERLSRCVAEAQKAPFPEPEELHRDVLA